MIGSRAGAPRRRGMAAVVMVVLLLLLNLIIIGMVLGGARDQDVTVRRVETVQAFYAAEAGVNMAIRELMEGTDEDGDGTVGSISDDGSDASDPAVGPARVVVRLIPSGGGAALEGIGRAGESRRKIQTLVE